jgi:hypothetical protein
MAKLIEVRNLLGNHPIDIRFRQARVQHHTVAVLECHMTDNVRRGFAPHVSMLNFDALVLIMQCK